MRVRPRRSLFGPIMLILIGVGLLAIIRGMVTPRAALQFFAEYWPAVFIVWGVVKLVEYLKAQRDGVPAPGIGGGGVVLLVFLTLVGFAATGTNRFVHSSGFRDMRDEIDFGDDEMNDWWNGPKFTFSDTLERDFPAGSTLKITVERGTIKVSPSSDNKLHVQINKTVREDDQAKANDVNATLTPQVNTVDKVMSVDFTGSKWQRNQVELVVLLPKKAPLDLMTMRGELEVRDRDGDLKLHNSRGSITLENVNGNIDLHERRGDLNAQKIGGDMNIDGANMGVNISDVTGGVTITADANDLQFSNIGKGVRYKSSRTDLELAKLDGSMNLSREELRANGIVGPFRLDTRDKDIRLEDVSGSARIKNSRGAVEFRPRGPFGNVEIENSRGTLRIALPTSGNFQVEASSHHGDIRSDYELNVTGGRDAHASGTINKGGAQVQLSNQD